MMLNEMMTLIKLLISKSFKKLINAIKPIPTGKALALHAFEIPNPGVVTNCSSMAYSTAG